MSSVADQAQKLERLTLGAKSGGQQQQQQQGDKDKAGAGSCVAYHQFVVSRVATTHICWLPVAAGTPSEPTALQQASATSHPGGTPSVSSTFNACLSHTYTHRCWAAFLNVPASTCPSRPLARAHTAWSGEHPAAQFEQRASCDCVDSRHSITQTSRSSSHGVPGTRCSCLNLPHLPTPFPHDSCTGVRAREQAAAHS
jgi:hypothetical protein